MSSTPDNPHSDATFSTYEPNPDVEPDNPPPGDRVIQTPGNPTEVTPGAAKTAPKSKPPGKDD